jgi:hypothetical protein
MRTHIHMLMPLLLICGTMRSPAQNDTTTMPGEYIIRLESGRKVTTIKIWNIGDRVIEYEASGSLHDLAIEEIRSIHYLGNEFLIKDGALIPAPHDESGLPTGHKGEMFELGFKDAGEHYHGGAALVAGFLTTPTLIGPPIIAAMPPHLNRNNPNSHLYKSDDQYRKGYRQAAREKKAGHVLIGMILGLMTVFLAMDM